MKRFGCPVECTPEAVGKRKENSRGKGWWEMWRAAVRSNDCGCMLMVSDRRVKQTNERRLGP